MCRIASIFLLQRLKGSMSGDARGFSNIETLAVIMVFFSVRHASSYATVKNWVAQFKRSDFSACYAPRPGRPNTVTTTEIIDQIHQLILEDHRILAESITEKLVISVSGLSPSFMKIWTCGSSPRSGSRNA